MRHGGRRWREALSCSLNMGFAGCPTGARNSLKSDVTGFQMAMGWVLVKTRLVSNHVSEGFKVILDSIIHACHVPQARRDCVHSGRVSIPPDNAPMQRESKIGDLRVRVFNRRGERRDTQTWMRSDDDGQGEKIRVVETYKGRLKR